MDRKQVGWCKELGRGHLTAMEWKDQWNAKVMMNMHSPPPAEDNFCDRQGNGLKPDYVRRGVSGEICMKNHYYIRRWPWKNKLFFHLLDLTILNSFLPTVIQIFTLTVQTDVGEGPNTEGRKGSLNLTRQKWWTPSTGQLRNFT